MAGFYILFGERLEEAGLTAGMAHRACGLCRNQNSIAITVLPY